MIILSHNERDVLKMRVVYYLDVLPKFKKKFMTIVTLYSNVITLTFRLADEQSYKESAILEIKND